MSKPDIIRAWKDAAYCDSLSAAECAALPDNPVGALGPPAAAGRK
jgi:mersacidin/lichenicidin family type 2 lantibiotic